MTNAQYFGLMCAIFIAPELKTGARIAFAVFYIVCQIASAFLDWMMK